MKLLGWNVHGLGNPRTLRALKKLIYSEDPEVVFLMETKLKVWQLEGIRIKLQMVGCVGVDRVGLSGGLAPFWKEGASVSLSSMSVGHINCKITFSNDVSVQFTGFYGNLETSLRDHS